MNTLKLNVQQKIMIVSRENSDFKLKSGIFFNFINKKLSATEYEAHLKKMLCAFNHVETIWTHGDIGIQVYHSDSHVSMVYNIYSVQIKQS